MKDVNVLSLKHFYQDDDYICLVTDLMDMNLMDYLNNHFDSLTRQSKLKIFADIVSAIEHCHELGFMHRDIKLQNILVNIDEEGTVTNVKLADFGFACPNKVLSSKNNFCGSLPYMAPE